MKVKQFQLYELSASSPSCVDLIIGERGRNTVVELPFLQVRVMLLMLRGYDDQDSYKNHK